MEYEQHEFYDIRLLSPEIKIKIIEHAYKINYEWWVDKLDCSESFLRQKINMSFNDIMSKFTNKSHFGIIERKGYNKPYYGEIGFRTMEDNIDYFLWIKISIFDLQIIVEEYDLNPIL